MPETTKTINNIKVTIRYPERIAESLKQDKINYIYDLLCPRKADEKK